MSFAAFMDDIATNCDDLDAFSDAVTKFDVQFDSVLLSLLDRIAQENYPKILQFPRSIALFYRVTTQDLTLKYAAASSKIM